MRGVEVGGRAVWLHQNENFFLYFSNKSAMWGVGEVLGGDRATLENRGDIGRCPGELRTPWVRGDSPAGVEVESDCGPNAQCEAVAGTQQTCVCEESYTGDPYSRCFPSVGNLVLSPPVQPC